MRIFETIYFLHSSHPLSYPSRCSVSRTEPPSRLDVINSTRDAFLYSGYPEGPVIPVKIGQPLEFRYSQSLLKYKQTELAAEMKVIWRDTRSNSPIATVCLHCWLTCVSVGKAVLAASSYREWNFKEIWLFFSCNSFRFWKSWSL